MSCLAEGERSLATLYWGPAPLMEVASEANPRRNISVAEYVTNVYVCMCVEGDQRSSISVAKYVTNVYKCMCVGADLRKNRSVAKYVTGAGRPTPLGPVAPCGAPWPPSLGGRTACMTR